MQARREALARATTTSNGCFGRDSKRVQSKRYRGAIEPRTAPNRFKFLFWRSFPTSVMLLKLTLAAAVALANAQSPVSPGVHSILHNTSCSPAQRPWACAGHRCVTPRSGFRGAATSRHAPGPVPPPWEEFYPLPRHDMVWVKGCVGRFYPQHVACQVQVPDERSG